MTKVAIGPPRTDYEKITVTPLTLHIGAEISGEDLNQDVYRSVGADAGYGAEQQILAMNGATSGAPANGPPDGDGHDAPLRSREEGKPPQRSTATGPQYAAKTGALRSPDQVAHAAIRSNLLRPGVTISPRQ